jgi:peptidoglycan/xylan/chitin deacetylase (PgdA/CDA1 family)
LVKNPFEVAGVVALKEQMIGAGFAFFRATGLHRRLAPVTRGCGAIVMLHHVRPWRERGFAPNRLLEIDPAFLDAALGRMRTLGFDVVTMDEALRRMAEPGERPFIAITFDDGYRDLADHALPILERHQAPFTAYITTGFADRTAELWWLDLEEAIRRADRIDIDLGGGPTILPAATDAEKAAAFQTLYWALRAGPEERLREVVRTLAARHGVNSAALVTELCLDWDGVRALARHPLCTIGAHTLTHPMLAKHAEAVARTEMDDSRRRIEMKVGREVRHFAYPVGDATSAGPRDFAMAAELGFASAVTTRPGMIFPEHAAAPTALPRLSLNGNWQSLDSLEILLSGVPFAIWNRGRRIAA